MACLIWLEILRFAQTDSTEEYLGSEYLKMAVLYLAVFTKMRHLRA